MKFHYKGTYDLNPDSLPQREHPENAVPFKEAESSAKLGLIANVVSIIILIPLGVLLFMRCGSDMFSLKAGIGYMLSFVVLVPHELLHAICFKEDVYMYTNLKQGMLFVVGTESMSKAKFVFMSLLPNIVLGVIPYAVALIYPQLVFWGAVGLVSIASGAGDYYNVFNALTQMPKGAKTYMCGFHSFWYMPE